MHSNGVSSWQQIALQPFALAFSLLQASLVKYFHLFLNRTSEYQIKYRIILEKAYLRWSSLYWVRLETRQCTRRKHLCECPHTDATNNCSFSLAKHYKNSVSKIKQNLRHKWIWWTVIEVLVLSAALKPTQHGQCSCLNLLPFKANGGVRNTDTSLTSYGSMNGN